MKFFNHFVDSENDGASVQAIADLKNSGAVISEYKLPLDWKKSGTMVKDLEIPEECLLICVIRLGMLSIPKGHSVIMAGDEVVALTIGSASKKLKKIFEL